MSDGLAEFLAVALNQCDSDRWSIITIIKSPLRQAGSRPVSSYVNQDAGI